jgi:hypothetical protein
MLHKLVNPKGSTNDWGVSDLGRMVYQKEVPPLVGMLLSETASYMTTGNAA